jgi:cation diffusion facilitator CzcD-associated flavoprotein CzcO
MQRVEVAIIGAGLGGLCAAIQLRAAGIQDFYVFERAPSVGGTWRDNTYPGCACDIPSHLYSFSFAPKRDWTQPFPSQPEILSYIHHLVARYQLGNYLRRDSPVTALLWNETEQRWHVHVRGQAVCSARFVVGALGPLNKPLVPAIAGREEFAGAQFHSSQWQHGASTQGKRIAVIGTGASAVQIVPELARQAAQLTLFQRTPSWVVPRPNKPYGALRRWLHAKLPLLQRANRWRIYWLNEWVTRSFLGSRWVRALLRLSANQHLRSQVSDSGLREQLRPNYEIGCKRILVSNHFYPALQQKNVQLACEAIDHIQAHGIVTRDGRLHPADVLVWCTGFRVTEFVDPALKIVGENAQSLGELWRTQPAQSHLGITVAGFPNLFLVVGPNTGLGSNSIIFMIECQVRYIVQAIRHMRTPGLQTACLRTPEHTQATHYAQVQARLRGSVWMSGCHSYYQSADGHLDTLWPASTTAYWWLTRRFEPSALAIG